MTTITMYLWGLDGAYAGSVQANPLGPMPLRSTPKAVPQDVPAGHAPIWRGGWSVEPIPQPQEPTEGAPVVPAEVPRWAGLLALKRHVLGADGALQLLGAGDARPDDNLLARVMAYRATLPAGELLDRLDVALNSSNSWLRVSPTVAMMADVLPLTDAQLDALFLWAHAQAGTV